MRAGWGECGGFCEEDEESRAGMGSPKSWAASTRARRMAALRWGRVLYKLLYAMSFLAAVYAVLAHFRSAPPISAAGTLLAPVSANCLTRSRSIRVSVDAKFFICSFFFSDRSGQVSSE